MSVNVELPSALARYAGGSKFLVATGGNVHELVQSLCDAHPQLRIRLLDQRNQLYPYLVLIKNNERLSVRQLHEIPLVDGDTLEIMTLACGG